MLILELRQGNCKPGRSYRDRKNKKRLFPSTQIMGICPKDTWRSLKKPSQLIWAKSSSNELYWMEKKFMKLIVNKREEEKALLYNRMWTNKHKRNGKS